jgi:2-amino-4-hydroxy-6-hydroxymethyldihydropteridine diphosphokinase
MVVSEIKVGGLYESAPLGDAAQPRYLNSALVGRTRLSPEPLLAVLKFLERRAGRRRGPRWSSRPLDLDLLLYEGVSSTRPELALPHPQLRARNFVLAPLADVAPDLPLPPDGLPVSALLATLGPSGLERRDWSESLPASGD